MRLFAAATLVLGCALVASAASIYDMNSVVQETPRINSGDALISSIMGDCFSADATMPCLKGKVLTYLDSKLGLQSEEGRAFAAENVDKVIFDRVGRILASNKFTVQLPETVFASTKITMNGRRGLDIEIPEEAQQGEENDGFNYWVHWLFYCLLFLLISSRSVEEEVAFARPRPDETEVQNVDAHFRRSGQLEGH